MSFFDPSMEPMLDMFIFESTTLLEQLDEVLLESDKSGAFYPDAVNGIFRIMHTIKGSSAMMGITSISTLAHHIEDLFFIIREQPDIIIPDIRSLFDILFQSSDALRQEIDRVSEPDYTPIPAEHLVQTLQCIIEGLKQDANANATTTQPITTNTVTAPLDGQTQAVVLFDPEAGMEHIRAFMLLTQMKDVCPDVTSTPTNPDEDPDACTIIQENGFVLQFPAAFPIGNIDEVLQSAMNLKSYEIITPNPTTSQPDQTASNPVDRVADSTPKTTAQPDAPSSKVKQSLISVKQEKLDQLMDLVGEIVIAESMVSSNSDLKGLSLDNFYKSARQLRKLTDELQDIAMSMRMVPLGGIFQKMNRIVRDVSRKLGKSVELITIGDETEVDKTINDMIADPFMHMVRNAVDHAIEMPEVRTKNGKTETGTVTLSAQTVGGEIIITISDDGKGLDATSIYEKASEKGLVQKPQQEYSEKDIFNMILLPGFSTKEEVTEFSGRGVGMDVVKKNIESVGGSLSVESQLGTGTTFTIKIPLTLAIVAGMTFSVGGAIFTMPITSIRESFKPSTETPVLQDTEGAEMIMVRGDCYPIIRLHETFEIPTTSRSLDEGILIIVESGDTVACLFVDTLIGEQQVVVKPFPTYLTQFQIKEKGLAGCTILGDGNISLILDIQNLLHGA